MQRENEPRPACVTVVGTGSWGTTLAILAARKGLQTYLLARTEDEAITLRNDRENRRFIPGVAFPLDLTPSADPSEALAHSDIVFMVVPSQTMRANILSLKPHLTRHGTLVVSCTKGLELGTLSRMTEVIVDELGSEWSGRVAALSGPNLAKEIIAGRPATSVVASTDGAVASRVQEYLTGGRFRVYTNPDIVGTEMAGSLKNIIALAAGMADGMQAGDSAKAALMTRGLVEIGRLGLAMGASLFTFAGLAGLGDLIATCASPFSRNRFFGQELAKGRPLEEIREELHGQVAEGVTTTVAARELAARHGVEMPITEQLYQILFEGKAPLEGLTALLTREPTDEFLSLGVLPGQNV
jgi:glycerol-3-phosphate dehydrogenase (NAD(P)+)